MKFRKVDLLRTILVCIFVSGIGLFFGNAQVAPATFNSLDHAIQSNNQCLSPDDRVYIQDRLIQNETFLRSKGLLQTSPHLRKAVTFDWPLRARPELDFFSYYGISNFVDQDLGGGIQDYYCGDRSYNGHRGTDIFSWPFSWYIYQNDLVEVIAGEAGTIIWKQDGKADDHCACSGSWNAVYVMHGDGSIAWYGHLKKGSLTDKLVGNSVTKGEYLGIMASSGCSTGPHLHLEVYSETPYNIDNLIDPYTGDCNDLNTNSWWTNQKPYWEPTLNALLTHHSPPDIGCPASNEIPNFSNAFDPGDDLVTASYFHDNQAGDVTQYSIHRPDNSVWRSWSHTSPANFGASFWYWEWTLPVNAALGVWTLQAIYRGQTWSHNFTVGPDPCVNPDINTWEGPLVGSWHQSPSYWSNDHIPLKCEDVLIPNGYFVTVNSMMTATCGQLEVELGGMLEVEIGAILESCGTS